VLPKPVRRKTRRWPAQNTGSAIPFAATSARVFNAVFVERDAEKRTADPIQQMATALDEGSR
jgi:hypothetical protein